MGKLTKNVMAGHLEEVFDVYGKILDIDLPIDKKSEWKDSIRYSHCCSRADPVNFAVTQLELIEERPGSRLHPLLPLRKLLRT